ncbi:response regulator [Desulfuromonas carbonis]|uniref:response regulator n=1 Tax=Desulfuromonas sp. DDH964 TaxID=1823759 RepID=UPI00078CB3BA|nr:response regulator [Desulfuromonas sp. DDH964]AMV73326.1 response regulator, PilZ domain-containing [Desulfuromonas sp. DDH964]
MLAKRILLTNLPEILHPMENSLFRREGFSLLIASDGRQAFEIIEDHDPALAILDLEMMNEGGDQCCRRVKNDPILRRTPVILVARRDREEDVLRCRQAGCNEILFKPVDPQELLHAACRILGIVERRAPRLGLTLPARVGRDPRHLRPATIHNLNAGGAFVETHKLFPVDSEIRIEFTLPDGSAQIQARCRVAWVNHPEWLKAMRLPIGMGLHFIALDDAATLALERFAFDSGSPPRGDG